MHVWFDITRGEENDAFDKVRAKIEAAHSSNVDETLFALKLSLRDLKAILQFYRRHA